jgi:hypothetical protein
MGRVFERARDQKGISVVPALMFLALLLFLSLGPFSQTAWDLVEPVVVHAKRAFISVLSSIYC